MELSLRPYVTAGVIVAGAGLLTATPLGPSAVQIQTRAVQLVAAEDLAAEVVSAAAVQQEFPVSTLADVFTNAFANLQALGSDFGSDPTPILSAILENGSIYAKDLVTAVDTAGTDLLNALQEFPSVLSTAGSDLSNGDFFDAVTSISQFLGRTPLEVFHALSNGFFEISQSMANHLANLLAPTTVIAFADSVSSALTSNLVPQWYSEIVEAQLFAPRAAELAFAGVGQDVVNAFQDGNSTLAIHDLVNGPATILDAVLNGYNLDGGGVMAKLVDAVPEALRGVSSQGLLSEEGTVATLRTAMETIARDISPAVKAEDVMFADAAAAATAGADVHTLAGDLSTLLSPDTAFGRTRYGVRSQCLSGYHLTADCRPCAQRQRLGGRPVLAVLRSR